jgi:hypothetical protein
MKAKAKHVGKTVVITASNADLRGFSCSPLLKTGGHHKVTKVRVSELGKHYFTLDNFESGSVKAEGVKVVKAKWSIYNNSIPWGNLSKKRQGKLRKAAVEGSKFCMHGSLIGFIPKFTSMFAVYIVVKAKWSIYNNSIPWENLSKKRQGKLRKAYAEDLMVLRDGEISVLYGRFNSPKGVYSAVRRIEVGSKVVVTASDDELRTNCCNELIKSGGTYTVTEVDIVGSYLLDGLCAGWVTSLMIKLKEVTNEIS